MNVIDKAVPIVIAIVGRFTGMDRKGVSQVRMVGFDPESEPTVSIIIPMYNQVETTLTCLESLAEHPSDHPVEVLVADDGSTDRDVSYLSSVTGVRIVTNESNLGFLRTCNRAVGEARGEWPAMPGMNA